MVAMGESTEPAESTEVATDTAEHAVEFHEPRPSKGPVTRAGRSWVDRAEGDRRARARLLLVEGEGVIVLNDRRVPGSKESIKLIAVSSSGVYVIDAKNYKGLVHTKRPGSFGNLGEPELHVGRRNCSASVDHVAHQMDVVRATLDATAWGAEVPVHGMLCLTRAEWGFASALQISDVWIGWPKLLAGQVQTVGVMDSPTVREVSVMISEHLPTS
jgi:hypothetical protein